MTSRGRPTKCTPELIARFAEQLEKGMYFEPTCALIGISKVTAYGWINRGRAELERVAEDPRRSILKDEQVFVDFLNACEEATANAEGQALEIIHHAAGNKHDGEWRAAAWFLERRLPDRWRERKGHDVKADVKVASAEDVAAALGVVLGEDE